MRRLLTSLLTLALLAGCATTLTQDALSTRFGPADPQRYDQPAIAAAGVPSYRQHVKPILDNRCVVCHGCYDAPCQVKLGSWPGVARGSSKAQVYGEIRLNEAPLTRLGVDAQRASQWRALGFDAVLNERSPLPEHQLAASVLWRSLQLKQAHPLPVGPVLSNQDFDFRLDRSASCPNLGEMDAHEQSRPLAGMPYGLPGLNAAELDTIRRWLQAGAPDDPPPALRPEIGRQITQWEAFLNGASRKQRLVGRYLYEHLFLGHLVFDGDAQQQAFRLVRSATPSGQPVQLLATRRPFDDPGPARVFYRLVPEEETLLAKTRMPYVLSAQRLARWNSWFLAAPYEVDSLPGYQPEDASNPFRTFAQIPLAARYRFLLDDAGYYVMNFIKGPVCRGQTALDVINDRFWVFFVDPEAGADEASAQLVARQGQVMRLPAAEGSNASLLAWRTLAQREDDLLALKAQALTQRFAGGAGGAARPVDLDFIWRGDGHNPNAALTIFRHFDSASVVRGLVGEPPKTAWLIGYPLLERIYYLLVAGYDVYGNTAHQLETRLYMDFLRMEGEGAFLMLLPQAARVPLRDFWYRDSDETVKQRVYGGRFQVPVETGIRFAPGEPRAQQLQLFQQLRQHLAPVLDHRFDLDREPDAALRAGLQQLQAVAGPALSWWPEAVVLRIDGAAAQPARYVSLLRNNGHRNVSTLLRENAALVPAEHSLTVVRGFIGAYPNALMHATVAELPALARRIAALSSEADYRALADRHAIRRTDAGFWAASDALHQAYRAWAPDEAGLFDYGRLENR